MFVIVSIIVIIFIYFVCIKKSNISNIKMSNPKYLTVRKQDTEELVVAVCMENVDWIDTYAD